MKPPTKQNTQESMLLQKQQEEVKTNENNSNQHTTETGKNVDNRNIFQVLENSPQKGRDMLIIGQENFNADIVQWVHNNKRRVAIEKLDQKEAEALGFKYPQDVRATIDHQTINHILKRHGVDSNLVKNSGQEPVGYNEIAQWRKYAKSADEQLFSKDDLNQDVILNFKQINGHCVIIESIRTKVNELALKTMYFEKGDYKESVAYKNATK